jgi:hypothetical protein
MNKRGGGRKLNESWRRRMAVRMPGYLPISTKNGMANNAMGERGGENYLDESALHRGAQMQR